MLKIRHSIENFSLGPAEIKQTEPYLVFTVDNEEFGVEAQKILELVKYITPLKMPSNYVNIQGMTIFRGEIIPVVDLHMIFGLEPIAPNDNWVIIVAESSIGAFGIIAERVSDLVFIPVNAIKKVSAFNYGEKLKYLKNVANCGEQMILLLDLEKIIETKPASIIDEEPTDSLSVVAVSELLECPKEPSEEVKEITRPETPDAGSQSQSSYLIDPKELEDLFNGIEPKPEQEAEEHLAEGSDINGSDLSDSSGNEGYYSDIAEDIQSLNIKSIQSELNQESLAETGDLLNPWLQPAVEIGPLTPTEEIGASTKNDQSATGWVDPMELEAILTGLENNKGEKNEISEVPNYLDQAGQALSNEAVESILKDLEAWSQSRQKEADKNSNQSLKLDQPEATEENSDV